MLGAMQREAGRQLVRRLSSADDLPESLRDNPTVGEALEARHRAQMLYGASGPVGVTIGVLAVAFFVLKKAVGVSALGPGGLLL
jgi:hypothetical protein